MASPASKPPLKSMYCRDDSRNGSSASASTRSGMTGFLYFSAHTHGNPPDAILLAPLNSSCNAICPGASSDLLPLWATRHYGVRLGPQRIGILKCGDRQLNSGNTWETVVGLERAVV